MTYTRKAVYTCSTTKRDCIKCAMSVCLFVYTLTQGQVLEQTMTWGVDSLIKVPPRFRTTAELVVSEDSFQGNFSVRSDVSGKVSVGAQLQYTRLSVE